MFTRFGGIDDLLKALDETKFDYVAIPCSWSNAFPGMVKVGSCQEFPKCIEIKGRTFEVVRDIPEMLMLIIRTHRD